MLSVSRHFIRSFLYCIIIIDIVYYSIGLDIIVSVKRGGGTCDISVKGEKIEEVKSMKYLGALFNEEGSCEEEIENRIGAASKVIGAMRTEVLHGAKRAEQGNKAESV